MHFDLWLAPMGAGLCGGPRLPIRGGVASTPAFGGRQRPSRGPCHFVRWKATRRGPRPGGVRTDVIATSMDVMGPFSEALMA